MSDDLRRIQPFLDKNIAYSRNIGVIPKLIMVSPLDVYVDEKYQRNLSNRSVSLIRKIVAEFNYRNYKPPILVPFMDGYKAIDGQHTLIAAATHPNIKRVPALVLEGDVTVTEQAQSFVSHNTNRIAVNPIRLFKARLAANDETALAISNLCESVGITIVYEYSAIYSERETLAVARLEHFYKRRTEIQYEMMLKIASNCNLAPIRVVHLNAIDHLLWVDTKDYAPYEIETALRDLVVDGEDTSEGLSNRAYMDLVVKIKSRMKK